MKYINPVGLGSGWYTPSAYDFPSGRYATKSRPPTEARHRRPADHP